MSRIPLRLFRMPVVFAAVLILLSSVSADAMITGVEGTSFDLWAAADHISTADGGAPLFWGFTNGAAVRPQYPGPTLIVNQGDTITINLTNTLSVPVSIVFPGQSDVTAVGGAPGLLTMEAPALGGTVQYSFTAARAGTYLYHSGTMPELQVEMGLLGAIIVRPYGFDPMAPRAYSHPDSSYDIEYLFLLSEMDPRIHQTVEFYGLAALEDTDYLSDYFPNYWFINGRNAMDTMFEAGAPWLPTQPYNCMPMAFPGQKLLMRVVSAGRDMHPFHHHGNHARIIARDGRLLESAPGLGADLSYEVFTTQSVPGETVDAIFSWTGKGLGWDIYGHDPADPLEPYEDPADHGKPLPVVLPGPQELAFGGFWGGSPFLGSLEPLPPGEGGLNPFGGLAFMWHSHTEKEMTNFDIFPGGMMTMFIVQPPGADIMP